MYPNYFFRKMLEVVTSHIVIAFNFPGTNGGFTPSGLLFSALGGFVIGVAYFIALLVTGVATFNIRQACLLNFTGMFAGIFGSLVDSIIGATCQYSGEFFVLNFYVEARFGIAWY